MHLSPVEHFRVTFSPEMRARGLKHTKLYVEEYKKRERPDDRREPRELPPMWVWGFKPLGILCTGGPDVIRKEAWPFYRTISGVRLCWELEEPKGPTGVGGVRLLAGHLDPDGRWM